MIAARAVHRAATGVLSRVDAIAEEGNAGLEAQKLHDVARFNGKLRNLVLVERRSQAGVRSVHERSRRGDLHGLAHARDLELDVQSCGDVHQQFQIRSFRGGKSRR